MTLAQAIARIEAAYNKQVTMIEFEDGSGMKFNFRLAGDAKARFIRFSK